jgi:hypothetical protein
VDRILVATGWQRRGSNHAEGRIVSQMNRRGQGNTYQRVLHAYSRRQIVQFAENDESGGFAEEDPS